MSYKSRKRLAFVATNAEAQWASMVTLTYPAGFIPATGIECKDQLSDFLKWFNRRHRCKKYLWFFESTKIGTPHIHILSEARIPLPVAEVRKGSFQNMEETFKLCRKWANLSRHLMPEAKHDQMSKVSVAFEKIRDPEGGAKYATKYAFKTEQKTFHKSFKNVGRFWGTSQGLLPEPKLTINLTYKELKDRGFKFFETPEGLIPYSTQFEDPRSQKK